MRPQSLTTFRPLWLSLSLGLLGGGLLGGCDFEAAHLHERSSPAEPAGPMPIAAVMDLDPAVSQPRMEAADFEAMAATPTMETGGTGDGLDGRIRFSTTTEGPSGGVFRNAVQVADLPLLWVRVIVSDMPTVALRKLVLIDPSGHVFLEEDGWYSTDPALSLLPGAPGGAAAVSTAVAEGASFALDQHVPFGYPSQPAPATGTWEVLAWLDGYPGTLRATLTVRP